jgi:hypothetical protein
MNTKLIILIVVLVSVVGIEGCTASAAQPPNTQALQETPVPPTEIPASEVAPQSHSNSEIVLNMVDALNNGDVEGSLAYFADDALVYLMGFPPTGIEVYHGHEQIGSLWQDSVDNHFRQTNSALLLWSI